MSKHTVKVVGDDAIVAYFWAHGFRPVRHEPVLGALPAGTEWHKRREFAFSFSDGAWEHGYDYDEPEVREYGSGVVTLARYYEGEEA